MIAAIGRALSLLARPIVRLLVIIIAIYQRTIARLVPLGSCRFSPTCSHYAREALETRGLVVGLALGAYRVLRCQPLCRGGYDPVPKKISVP